MNNTPNPLIPQGSLQQASAKSKSNFRLAFFIVVIIHVGILGGILMVGCKREDENGVDANKQKDILTKHEPLGSEYYPAPPVTPATPSTNGPDPFGGAGMTPAPTPAPAPTNGGGIGLGAMPAPVAPPTAVEHAPMTPGIGTGMSEYTIARGDTFATIAKKLGVPVSAVVNANPGVDPRRLQIGQVIKVPAGNGGAVAAAGVGGGGMAAPATNGETYTVKSGDTLTGIARKHGTTVPALKSANNLRTDRINAGQKLKIPGAAGAGAGAAPTPAAPATPTPDPFGGGGLPASPGNP